MGNSLVGRGVPERVPGVQEAETVDELDVSLAQVRRDAMLPREEFDCVHGFGLGLVQTRGFLALVERAEPCEDASSVLEEQFLIMMI